VAALLIGIYLYIVSRGIGYAEVGLSYDQAIRKLELWRIFTAQLSHVELLHLLFNLSTLWSLGAVETRDGMAFKISSLSYLHTSLILLIFSGLVSGCHRTSSCFLLQTCFCCPNLTLAGMANC
jgi:membrane associated rhomboid family serine protease